MVKYHLNFLLLLILFIVVSCKTDEKKKDWIITENGLTFWGFRAAADAKYQWDGDSIFNIANGKGTLKVTTDNGEYTNKVTLHLNYGSLREDEWKKCPNGRFLGKMEENCPQGFGILQIGNRTTIGIFNKGKLVDGIITILIKDSILYHGEIEDNFYNGNGDLYAHGKLLYTGHWRKGKYNGYGKEYSEGNLVYSGNWKDGLYNGGGTLFVDGNAIKGDWDKGHLQGALDNRISEQVIQQYKLLLGKDLDKKKQVAPNLISYTDAETYVFDSIPQIISKEVRETIKENVEDRFGLLDLPRIFFQKLFSDNSDRMDYAQKALTENIMAEEIQDLINEKIRFYNEQTLDSVKLKGNIKLEPIGRNEIVDDAVFEQINARETSEYTDVLLDITFVTIISTIIGSLIGYFFRISNITGVVGFILGFILGVFLVGKAQSKLEDKISEMATHNYMIYIENQNISSQTIYK